MLIPNEPLTPFNQSVRTRSPSTIEEWFLENFGLRTTAQCSALEVERFIVGYEHFTRQELHEDDGRWCVGSASGNALSGRGVA
jgi:hypothetical protein